VSLGSGCAQANRPGLYTNVADPTIASFLRTASGLPEPPPEVTPRAASDTARPTMRLRSRSCTRTRCVVRVTVADVTPSSGIRSVSATLRWSARESCTRNGRRTTCLRKKSRKLKATSISGSPKVVATRLVPKRRYTVTLRATDKAGNAQRKAKVLAIYPGR
jgi:hypothetical protein